MEKEHIDWILLEDECHTANELVRLVSASKHKYRNIAVIDTWKGFRKFWQRHAKSDLIIADEFLADGSIFRSLHEMDIPTPMIVVTSNENLRKEDFPAHVVDILLHPVRIDGMSVALNTFENIH